MFGIEKAFIIIAVDGAVDDMNVGFMLGREF